MPQAPNRENTAPNQTGNIPPIFGQLNDSIRNLTARLEQMQARDPSQEFAYREDSTHVRGSDYSYSKIDSYLAQNFSSGDLQRSFGTQISPRFFEFYAAHTQTNAAGIEYSHKLQYQLEFDFDPNYTRPTKVFVPGVITFGANNANAATEIQLSYNYRAAIKYRFVRVSLVLFNVAGNPTYSLTYPGNNYSIFSPLAVTFYGE